MDDQKTEDKLSRFHEENLRGLKERRLLHLSSGEGANYDDAYSASADPAFQNVSVQNGACYSPDNDA